MPEREIPLRRPEQVAQNRPPMNELPQALAQEPAIAHVVWPLLAAGLAVGLLGWTLYWTGVHVIGAVAGGAVGLAGAMLGSTALEITENAELILVIGGALFGAILGMLLMRVIQFYVFFVLGATLGTPMALAALRSETFASQPWAQGQAAMVGAVVLGALVGGAVVLFGRKYVISILTAAAGAVAVALSLPLPHQEWIVLGAFAVFLAVQLGFVRRYVRNDQVDRALRRDARRA
jgi:hypothetical protein